MKTKNKPHFQVRTSSTDYFTTAKGELGYKVYLECLTANEQPNQNIGWIEQGDDGIYLVTRATQRFADLFYQDLPKSGILNLKVKNFRHALQIVIGMLVKHVDDPDAVDGEGNYRADNLTDWNEVLTLWENLDDDCKGSLRFGRNAVETLEVKVGGDK